MGQPRRLSSALGMSAFATDYGRVAALPRTVETGQLLTLAPQQIESIHQRICRDTYGTSPPTQLSCGAEVIWKTLPGSRSRRVPSSYSTMPCPDNTVPVCGAWQSRVPTVGAL